MLLKLLQHSQTKGRLNRPHISTLPACYTVSGPISTHDTPLLTSIHVISAWATKKGNRISHVSCVAWCVHATSTYKCMHVVVKHKATFFFQCKSRQKFAIYYSPTHTYRSIQVLSKKKQKLLPT